MRPGSSSPVYAGHMKLGTALTMWTQQPGALLPSSPDLMPSPCDTVGYEAGKCIQVILREIKWTLGAKGHPKLSSGEASCIKGESFQITFRCVRACLHACTCVRVCKDSLQKSVLAFHGAGGWGWGAQGLNSGVRLGNNRLYSIKLAL